METTTMTGVKFSLEQLRQQILDLPLKKKRAERIGNVGQYLSKLRQHNQKLQQLLKGRRCAPIVFDAISLTKVDDQVKQATRAARALHKRLAQDPARVSDATSSSKVAAIGTHCQAAEKALMEQWAEQIKAVVTRYEKLIAALERLRLDGANLLMKSLMRLSDNGTNPPYTHENATALRADVEALAGTIATLGLSGSVGQFLTKAADRNLGADPRDLFKSEVREFFDKNDLWGMLGVFFRI